MKKRVRLLLGLGAGLAAVIIGICLLCLEGVDYRPYLAQPYFIQTAARLKAEEATNVIIAGELAVGFGRVLLTPTLGAVQDEPKGGKFRSLPLAGYGERHGRPATGVHDDLLVKALAFRVGERTGVVVGADALIVPPEVGDLALRRLRQEAGLSREQVYLGATHTHSSLGGWGEGKVAEAFAGPFQPGVRVWFADRIVRAVRQALDDLQPASLGQGHFAAPDFVRNRLVGAAGQVDPEFSFVAVRQKEGKMGVLGSYSAHATVLSGRVMEFSADYPGYWERAMEQATGGTALFLAGGVGSQAPVPGASGFAGAQRMGEALARDCLRELGTLSLTNRISFGVLGLKVDLPPLQARLSDGVRLRPWLARRLLTTRTTTFLQAFRLDRAIWISTPCDFSGELALELKDFLRARGSEAVVTSFNGDYIGYVIPGRYYHLGGYEPRLMSFFGPNVPDYLEQLLRQMALDAAR